MSKSIYQIVDDLPKINMTVRMLHALDWVVPGQWQNIVGFENTIKAVTGETDQKLIQKIGERAIALYNDKSQGYQRALWLYQTVDYVQGVAGFGALLSKLGESFSFLSFLDKLTPKSDTTQAVDLGLKVVTEIACFCQVNGIPGDSVGDFVESLADYKHEALMRMAAMICVDGLIPLGPDFLDKALALIDKTGASGLESNSRYNQIKEYIPGKNTAEQITFMQKGLSSVKDWSKSFVSSHNLGVDKVVASLRGTLPGVESHLDYLGAFLDMSVNYYEHTGTQSIARSLISRAAAEI
ncbi:hypothetical protein ETAA8_56310 [Anatilimnocola aggregata]|uniref:Uncharacterized protein n=1 Tax=Anatilimnocola aggregata TaxID=2528021 RepID=A0A517YJT6_9BACT|nr:hypothetical protein [Anatilimnocola aggregata]QDU30491.1 hypothetical protein ETAA8_56310 [Anatilimnocola aggregata]